MTDADQSSPPPAATDSAGKVFVVFGVDAADADAKLAALAGPDGPGPHDDVVVIHWLSEGEPPPGQVQPKSLGDAQATADAEPGAVTGSAPGEGSAGK